MSLEDQATMEYLSSDELDEDTFGMDSSVFNRALVDCVQFIGQGAVNEIARMA